MRFEVDLPSHGNDRGVYLRDVVETREPTDVKVRVRPKFSDDADGYVKAKFELRVALEASEPWVQVGGYLVLMNGGRTFDIAVDPTQLPPGAHYAEVRGYDDANRDRGPIFRVPITVMRTQEMAEDHTSTETLPFEAGAIQRRFFAVPQAATWADISLKLDADGPRTFFVQAVEKVAGTSYRDHESKHALSLEPGVEKTFSFAVTAGQTVEMCLAQYWSSLGTSELRYRFSFHGLAPGGDLAPLTAEGGAARVDVTSALAEERIDPAGKLTTWRHIVAPRRVATASARSQRDRLPDGRQVYHLVLTYEFDQPKAGTLTPRFPEIDGLLYESPLCSQLWMLFDSGKRRVAVDDTFPDSHRLRPGRHTLRLELRDADPGKLEKYKNLPLCLDRPLAKSVSLGIYPTRVDSVSDGSKFSARVLQRGQRVGLYLAPPGDSEIPAGASAGDLLLGSVTFGKADDAEQGSGHRPGGFPLRYVVGTRGSEASGNASKSSSPNKKPGEEKTTAEDELLEFEVAQLKKINFEQDRQAFDKLLAEILKQRPNYLPALVVRLHKLDSEAHRKDRLPEVVKAADAVLAQIDTKQLALVEGTRVNSDDPQAVREAEKWKSRRATLVDTLYRKGRALGYMELPDVVAKHPIKDQAALDKAFEANFAELRKWVDTTDKQYFLLHVRRDRRLGRYGAALKLLNKYIADSPPTYWYYKKRRDIYRELDWKPLADYAATWLPIRFPAQREPF